MSLKVDVEVVRGDVIVLGECLVAEKTVPFLKGFSPDASASTSSFTFDTGASPSRSLQRGNLSTVCRTTF